MREGKFPKAVKIGSSKNAWLADEIDNYLEQQIINRTATA
jgi:predicted DNA-binding transcriptional regulator AlpA